MINAPIYVPEVDHAALVDELAESRTQTEARLDAQSRAISRLMLTVRDLEGRLAARPIV
jgi:hypothetical protein